MNDMQYGGKDEILAAFAMLRARDYPHAIKIWFRSTAKWSQTTIGKQIRHMPEASYTDIDPKTRLRVLVLPMRGRHLPVLLQILETQPTQDVAERIEWHAYNIYAFEKMSLYAAALAYVRTCEDCACGTN